MLKEIRCFSRHAMFAPARASGSPPNHLIMVVGFSLPTPCWKLDQMRPRLVTWWNCSFQWSCGRPQLQTWKPVKIMCTASVLRGNMNQCQFPVKSSNGKGTLHQNTGKRTTADLESFSPIREAAQLTRHRWQQMIQICWGFWTSSKHCKSDVSLRVSIVGYRWYSKPSASSTKLVTFRSVS
jgi:hypothetical protein